MKKLNKNLVSMVSLLVLLILVLAAIYAFGSYHFKTHFFGGSKINGVNVGEMTEDEAKYAIQNQIRQYTLTVKERGGAREYITGDQLYMSYVDDGTVTNLLKKQNVYLWPLYLGRGKKYTVDIGFTYDVDAVAQVMDQMAAFSAENEVAPEDAHLVDDGKAFVVAQGVQGAKLDREKTRRALIQTIEQAKTEIDLEAEQLYETPSGSVDDESLQQQAKTMNDLLKIRITYNLDDQVFAIDSNNIRSFITANKSGVYQLDRKKLKDFVANMAYETDTYGLKHKFRTTSGRTIELAGGGDYGWCINQEETAYDLYNAILKGESGEREPVYLYRGIDRSSNDIGGTYVEICIEKQEMWCYQNGVLKVDTPVVTGNHALGQDTPSGCVWAIDLKKSPAQFPEAHNVQVQYWLPFFDSCGVHDASWRAEGEYGGSTWKTNGSNGCINTPKEAAGQIYDIMERGYPVIVYYSEDQPVGPQPTHEVTPG